VSAERALLVITDPAARSVDGESVRVAWDVLRAAAPAKIVVPADSAELERALARRGRRRVVVVAGDGGVHAVVRLLERRGELAETPLGVVPVAAHPGAGNGLATALGLPAEPAKAARVALGEHDRALDLLVDDLGGVALRSVRIGHGVRPVRPASLTGPAARKTLRQMWDRATHSVSSAVGQAGHRLRVEADGEVLADTDRPLLSVRVGCDDCGNGSARFRAAEASRAAAAGPGALGTPGAAGTPGDQSAIVQERSVNIDGSPDGPFDSFPDGAGPADGTGTRPAPTTGTASVLVTGCSAGGRFGLPAQTRGADRAADDASPHGLVEVRAREITVCGDDFTYEADAMATGPVRLRTWTVRAAGWRLYVPAPEATSR